MMNVLRKKSVEQTLAETGESGRSLKRDLTWWDRSAAALATASTAVATLEMLIFCGSCVFVITTRVLPESDMHAR